MSLLPRDEYIELELGNGEPAPLVQIHFPMIVEVVTTFDG